MIGEHMTDVRWRAAPGRTSVWLVAKWDGIPIVISLSQRIELIEQDVVLVRGLGPDATAVEVELEGEGLVTFERGSGFVRSARVAQLVYELGEAWEAGTLDQDPRWAGEEAG